MTQRLAAAPRLWNGRRYYSLDCYLKQTFGEKLYKLSLNGGMTCPNRDGTVGVGGCIFCSEGGSGDFAADVRLSMDEQIQQAKQIVSRKFSGDRYIAYFQAFTNTYASVDYLERLFLPVIQRDDIAVLSIATRPDCLEDDKLRLLKRLNRLKPVWVELGLQTIHPSTAEWIRRGYSLTCYDKAVRQLREIGVTVIVHTILGLPQETHEDMLQTAAYVAQSGADGIKLQLLHILEGTPLAEQYRSGTVTVMTEEDYLTAVTDIVSILPPEMVIHRLTGDGDRQKLLAPRWSGDKRHVLNAIHQRLKARNLYQGIHWHENLPKSLQN